MAAALNSIEESTNSPTAKAHGWLFTSPEIALAGWIHYLAFDLFVGAWEVRTARREGIAFLLVLPCLALTFLFGPAGFLVFSMLRAARATQLNVAEAGR